MKRLLAAFLFASSPVVSLAAPAIGGLSAEESAVLRALIAKVDATAIQGSANPTLVGKTTLTYSGDQTYSMYGASRRCESGASPSPVPHRCGASPPPLATPRRNWCQRARLDICIVAPRIRSHRPQWLRRCKGALRHGLPRAGGAVARVHRSRALYPSADKGTSISWRVLVHRPRALCSTRAAFTVQRITLALRSSALFAAHSRARTPPPRLNTRAVNDSLGRRGQEYVELGPGLRRLVNRLSHGVRQLRRLQHARWHRAPIDLQLRPEASIHLLRRLRVVGQCRKLRAFCDHFVRHRSTRFIFSLTRNHTILYPCLQDQDLVGTVTHSRVLITSTAGITHKSHVTTHVAK
jgi:hypothetical protein